MPMEKALPVSAAEARDLFADLVDAPALVLAVSGGPDSTALLYLAARWRAGRKSGPKLLAVTVDHGLRAESAREALAVKRLAKSLRVPHRTLRWEGKKPSSGLQQAARQARYRLLAGAARKARARHILTAHTRDDQAETVLIRLARGSGVTGLAAMARSSLLPASGEKEITLLRPLLEVPKSRLLATLRAAGILYADDSSNRDPRFTRVRLREAMPTLEREGLTASRLVLLARRARRADAAIEAAVDQAAGELSAGIWSRSGPIRLDALGFAGLSPEISLRLLGRAIARVGDEGPVELGKLEALHAAMPRPNGAPIRFRRTLAGALVTCSREAVTVERAPARRRIVRGGALTTIRHRKTAFN